MFYIFFLQLSISSLTNHNYDICSIPMQALMILNSMKFEGKYITFGLQPFSYLSILYTKSSSVFGILKFVSIGSLGNGSNNPIC